MARIALGIVTLALVFGSSGCTWTQTYADYPPHLMRGEPGHDHPHPHSHPLPDHE